MHDLLIWTYVVNATLLVCHEIDSAFWKEWEMFRLPGGRTGFILLHVPLITLVLYGLMQMERGGTGGLAASIILGSTGVIAFGIHMTFIRKGRPEFTDIASLMILWATLLVSVFEIAIAAHRLAS